MQWLTILNYTIQYQINVINYALLAFWPQSALIGFKLVDFPLENIYQIK